MGRSHQILPRLIIEWSNGLDHKPTGYALGDTDQQVRELEQIFVKIAQREDDEHKAEAE